MEYGFEGSRGSHIWSFAFFGAYVIHVSTLKIKTNDWKDITAPSGRRGRGRNLNSQVNDWFSLAVARNHAGTQQNLE
jgi:hypothetical protein